MARYKPCVKRNFVATLTILTAKSCDLLNSVQKVTEIQGWLNSIIVEMSEKRDSSIRQ